MRIYEDLRVVQQRLGLLQIGVAGLLGLLFVYFWYLQVLRGRHYRDLAESNRIRTLELAAPRGTLLDRHGRTLVGNRPSFNILLTPELSDDLDRTVVRLARILKMGEGPIRERLAKRVAPLRHVIVKADASLGEVALVEARRLELPEVSVAVVPLRSYPLAAGAAHALGRVGEITHRQLHSPGFESLEPGDLVGQAGIELLYNHELMGRNGARRVVVNSRGLEVGEVERHPPDQGPSLSLTVDAELQARVERALGGRPGSAVALDPVSGAILAMTSTPAYDPNTFTTGIDPGLWAALRSDARTPLMNRVIQGQYAPGSVFKIVMAIAALEEGIVTPETEFRCSGALAIYNTVFRCNRAGGHGRVRLREALAQSCNVYFYQVGVRLEIEQIARYARRMGLGDLTGVDLPHEVSGLVPSPEWKRRVQHQPWFPGETVSVAIGQGQLSVTPLQAARLVAIVANDGKLPRPHLVARVGGRAQSNEAPRDLGFAPTTIAAVREGLCAVVNGGGTGWRARLPGTEVCGKTGSAQVIARARLEEEEDVAPRHLPHAWFVAFAPAEEPQIALAVLVENGGSGGQAAAPVARQILAHYFGVRLPPQVPITTGD